MRLHHEGIPPVQDDAPARPRGHPPRQRGQQPGVHRAHLGHARGALGRPLQPPRHGLLQPGNAGAGLQRVSRRVRRQHTRRDHEAMLEATGGDHLRDLGWGAAGCGPRPPAVCGGVGDRLPAHVGEVPRVRVALVGQLALRQRTEDARVLVRRRHPQRLRPGALRVPRKAGQLFPVPRAPGRDEGHGVRLPYGEGRGIPDQDRGARRPSAVQGAARRVPSAGGDRSSQGAAGRRARRLLPDVVAGTLLRRERRGTDVGIPCDLHRLRRLPRDRHSWPDRLALPHAGGVRVGGQERRPTLAIGVPPVGD